MIYTGSVFPRQNNTFFLYTTCDGVSKQNLVKTRRGNTSIFLFPYFDTGFDLYGLPVVNLICPIKTQAEL